MDNRLKRFAANLAGIAVVGPTLFGVVLPMMVCILAIALGGPAFMAFMSARGLGAPQHTAIAIGVAADLLLYGGLIALMRREGVLTMIRRSRK